MSNPTDRPGPQTKAFDAAEVNLTPGERSDVSWITTDVVDNEGDVVVAKGIDFASVFLKNPVVMACHDYQRWPVGKAAWIKPAKTARFSGLTAKTMWDEDEDAARLFGMVQRDVVRGRSIGFRPPDDFRPGDWGPPTPDEVKARPDWASARRVIRRCVLLEYSVCPIPMNQESLTLVVSKALSLGLPLPTYMQQDKKTMSEGSGADGGYAEGDSVEWGHGRKGMCGKVCSMHKAGMVPGCKNEMEASEDAPACKVERHAETAGGHYRPMGEHHAVKAADLTRIEALAMEPEASADDKGVKAATPPEVGISFATLQLPPFRTLDQVNADLIGRLTRAFDPAGLAESAAKAAMDRARGAI